MCENGCIGLNRYRLGLPYTIPEGGDKYPFRELPGTKGFLNPADAYAYYKELQAAGKGPVIWAIQTPDPEAFDAAVKALTIKLKDAELRGDKAAIELRQTLEGWIRQKKEVWEAGNGYARAKTLVNGAFPSELDPNSIQVKGGYNYSTLIQDKETGKYFWEWMNYGKKSAEFWKQPWLAKRRFALPETDPDGYPYITYYFVSPRATATAQPKTPSQTKTPNRR